MYNDLDEVLLYVTLHLIESLFSVPNSMHFILMVARFSEFGSNFLHNLCSMILSLGLNEDDFDNDNFADLMLSDEDKFSVNNIISK